VLTETVGRSVSDLVAVGQHQATNQLAVLSKRPRKEKKIKR